MVGAVIGSGTGDPLVLGAAGGLAGVPGDARGRKPAPPLTATAGPVFEIVNGSEYCFVSGDGSCITDGPGDYGHDEECHVRVTRRTTLQVLEFSVLGSPWSGDRLSVDGVDYYTYPGSEKSSNPLPAGLLVRAGARIRWKTNYHKSSSGFSVCGSQSPYAAGGRLGPLLAQTRAAEKPPHVRPLQMISPSELTPVRRILISCGSHISLTGCGGCPQGNGEAWCNGECRWHRAAKECRVGPKLPVPAAGRAPVHPPSDHPLPTRSKECTMPAVQQFAAIAAQGRRLKRPPAVGATFVSLLARHAAKATAARVGSFPLRWCQVC